MKQSVVGLSSGIKKNLEQSESDVASKWVAVRVTLSLDNFGSTDRSRLRSSSFSPRPFDNFGSTGRSRLGSNTCTIVKGMTLDLYITKKTFSIEGIPINGSIFNSTQYSFKSINGSKFIFLVLYMDDILLASNDLSILHETK
ncbi:hypothetical protein CR513_55066, partial [Mucuna pruriens]